MNLQAQWIVGFVDGEGCFHIGISKNTQLKHNVQVLPEFVVTQHTKDEAVLYALKTYFQCGVVRKNHTKSTSTYRVRNHHHLYTIILPFFEKHLLKTSKRVDFLKFRKVVRLMHTQQHLTTEGFEHIQKIRASRKCSGMNDILF
jgi:hypothetical protein